MQNLIEQFRNYYTPKRLLINALIMTAATLFFIYQRPEEPLLGIGFGTIAAIYFGFFVYRKLKPTS
ncbi:hypothetical protein [Salegentibacter salegens]|jgi:hypothetical protein|uniref:PEP-CTERM protein-sorting domain-containing protein n=1 Tax=Salegentibacter salegens TaxID=143223 RepID=A0A1M7KNL8_9FLAO|nr:hypothetical protein [Salegentibacter salegens]PRX48872.1 hypothetical protein LY58_01164 [Salegentibacter salegens]SHM67012.1 hypothetical protein SAMN05878281_1527 [Salegentibacter salegens]